MEIKQIERCQPKHCLIFRHLPFKTIGSDHQSVAEFIQSVWKVQIEVSDLNACHPLARCYSDNTPRVIVKFVHFDQKVPTLTGKGLLRDYKNPKDGKPICIFERLSNYHQSSEELVEEQKLRVPNNNSAPMIRVEANARTPYH